MATKKDKTQPSKLTAKLFLTRLKSLEQTSTDNDRYFQYQDTSTKHLNIRMLDIFKLAKEFMKMPLDEVQMLLKNEFHEARVGAVSIMDFQARDKKTTPDVRKKLFDLYIDNHKYINNWDLVDRSAPYVVGGYLFDKPRKILYQLAKSNDAWERRTSIVATYFFIRQNQIDDTFKIGELLVNDKHDLINKAVGSWIREAGKRDKQRLIDFLDKHAATMPRVTLRYAIEKLDKRLKEVYLAASKIKA